MKIITKLKNYKKKDLDTIYIAADFETIIINNIHYVYAIGLKDKNFYKNFIIDFIDLDENNIKYYSLNLIKKFLDYLLYNYNNNIYVYFHNLSGFDGFFIIKTVNNYYKNIKKDIIIRDNRIYKICIKNITFYDSLNIIKDSLDNIGKTFFNKPKITFDHNKIKTIQDLVDNMNILLIYMERDVDILNDLISMWSKKIYQMFNIDITNNFTISSIAMAYYRKYYINNYQIEITRKYKYDFIKKSYFGGFCNVLNTISDGGFYYDINSLYPSQMKNKPYPTGKSSYIYKCDNINENDLKNYIGYAECLVYVPENIVIPPLPYRYKNNVLQPTGYLKNVWFIPEILNAIKLGCKLLKIFKIIKYENEEYIFEDFINELYFKRVQSNNIIEKTLYKNIMNSLYGRFGISLDLYESIWYDDTDKDDIDYLKLISNTKNLNEDNNILTYKIDENIYENFMNDCFFKTENKIKLKNIYEKYNNTDNFIISSIQIASAISSYSRIKLINDMTNHIKHNNAIIYYYDTDSIITNKPLNDELISKKLLGKYKLECEFIKGVFIAPKIYSLVKINNDIIIKFKGVDTKKYLISYDDLKNSLKKDKKMFFKNIIKYFKKDFKNLDIQSKTHDLVTINFESKKYEKIYYNNIFIKTKPIHIKNNEII